jgi:hypothetical protein
LFVIAVLVGCALAWAMIVAAMSQRWPNCFPGALCLSDLAANLIFYGSAAIALVAIAAMAWRLSARGDR